MRREQQQQQWRKSEILPKEISLILIKFNFIYFVIISLPYGTVSEREWGYQSTLNIHVRAAAAAACVFVRADRASEIRWRNEAIISIIKWWWNAGTQLTKGEAIICCGHSLEINHRAMNWIFAAIRNELETLSLFRLQCNGAHKNVFTFWPLMAKAEREKKNSLTKNRHNGKRADQLDISNKRFSPPVAALCFS
jgi:hypothetical protein